MADQNRETPMSIAETSLIGKRGSVVLPPRLRQQLGIREGSLVMLEEREGGILIRPLAELIEEYTPERRAELMLNNAVDEQDYQDAVLEVQRMGIDPASIPHRGPGGD
jgi:AbrB family looped-hinge helix DNA binding protein